MAGRMMCPGRALRARCTRDPWPLSYRPHEIRLLFQRLSVRNMATPPTGRTYRKTTGTPDYDDPTFWDTKFATGKDVGEWLNSGDALIEAVMHNLQTQLLTEEKKPKVLHLGPGISKLGARVRDAFTTHGWTGNGIVVGQVLEHPIPSSELTGHF